MKKKILSFALAAAMVVTMLPTIGQEVKAANNLSNPRIVEDSSMKAGQKVTWDCVWFGAYPQTEIVDKAETCGTTGQTWEETSDYEVNSSLFSQLEKETDWNSNGDITIGSVKYRRIQESDAAYSQSGYNTYYEWSNSSATYHYFRYEPIKWRVLNVDGNQALLLADKVLDDQRYNLESMNTTWEDTTLRSWLNGYDSSANYCEIDYSSKNFIDAAFTSGEQSAILNTELDNSTTGPYSKSIGGNNTTDQVFLLSSYDMYNTDVAASYGFYKDDYRTRDDARQSLSTTYAKAMGTHTYTSSGYGALYNGNCSWWLRSNGSTSMYAAYASDIGEAGITGTYVYTSNGVRPALYLNLTSSSWNSAGTVCSDEMLETTNGGNSDSGGNSGSGTVTHTHSWDSGKITKEATNTSGAVKIYTCTGCKQTKTETVGSPISSVTLYRYVNKSYTLTSASAASWSITSGSKYASLKGTVLTLKKAGTVVVKDSKSGKSVTITIKNPSISTKTKVSVKKGKTLQLKATATPKASVKYSLVSKKYKKYATVTSSGKVKGKKKGTCYIYAKANGVKKKIKVTVK